MVAWLRARPSLFVRPKPKLEKIKIKIKSEKKEKSQPQPQPINFFTTLCPSCSAVSGLGSRDCIVIIDCSLTLIFHRELVYIWENFARCFGTMPLCQERELVLGKAAYCIVILSWLLIIKPGLLRMSIRVIRPYCRPY